MIPFTSVFAGGARSLDTITVRAATRVLGAVVLFCVFLGAARGADAPENSHARTASEPTAAPESKPAPASVEHPAAASSAEENDPASTAEVPAATSAAGGHAESPTPATGHEPAKEAATAAQEPHGAATASAAPVEGAEDLSLQGHIGELADVGTRFWLRGEYETAERVFADALSLNAPVEMKRKLLLRMVQLYQDSDQLIRAIAVLEKFLLSYPDDPEYPQMVMRLGLLYRETGAYAAATSRFYQVLNSTMRLGQSDLDERRRLATKARLEIADTYLSQGNFEEARKFYSLLQLLDLDPADRERVEFREGQLQHELRLWQPAEKSLGAFLLAHPESTFAPEARYLRAQSLKELGRKDEAVQEVVALLRAPDQAEDPGRARNLAYWKRRTGNELANNFYTQGDILGALAIYQALARASEDPAWRWPAVYQVGLCFERLHLPQRAAEAYQVIVEPAAKPTEGQTLSETLVSLQGMAQWRLQHLTWIDQFEKKLQDVTSTKPADAGA